MSRAPTAPGAKPPVVVLCGFMGTGKTAVGRALAEMLGVDFIDTDSLVERRADATVEDIFARDGEACFRSHEAEVCASLHPVAGAVIATGGGALLRDETFRHLSSLGTLVLLEASLDAILARTLGEAARPRLPRDAGGSADRDRVASLLAERRPVYDRVAFRLDTSRKSPQEAAFEIAERLRRSERIVHLRVDMRPIPGHTPRPGEARLSRIVVGRGVASRLGEWLREIGLSKRVFVLTPRRVAAFHGKTVRASLDAARIPHRFIEVDDAEESKSMEQVEQLLYELVDSGATREAAVIALGGGVTGDLVGLVAATYMRGLPFVQLPTTLLAQVDASIGGKVGVNHPRAKNLIGAIHQPHLVLSDVELLSTLPDRELSSGMAEVVKTAIIGSPPLFDRLREMSRGSGTDGLRDQAFLEGCVAECTRVKAAIVEEDPYEGDRRRVLNLGHTLGHALEAATGYQTLTHGEAVALGLLAAIRLSVRRGAASQQLDDDTRAIVAACGLPVRAPDVDASALADAIGLDKKRRASGLAFVLPIKPGEVRIVEDVTEEEILAASRELPRERRQA